MDGSSSTIRTTTTYETKSSSYQPDLSSAYRTTITPRHLVIQRSGYGNVGPTGGVSSSVSIQRGSMFGSFGAGPGGYATVTTTGVNSVKNTREQEKKDMQDLNERFASYIEKVRFLEAQNRKLADELDKLKSKWGKETAQVKAMYQAELDEARRLLDEAEKEKARLEIRVASLEEQLDELRQK